MVATAARKWDNPEHQAYWNKRLKAEGLGVIKGRQIVKKGRPPSGAAGSPSGRRRRRPR